MCVWDIPENKRICKLCKLTDCEERNTNWGKLSEMIRQLPIHKPLRLDQERYNSARTVAYRISKQYDRKFTVLKRGRWVIIERLS